MSYNLDTIYVPEPISQNKKIANLLIDKNLLQMSGDILVGYVEP